MRIGVLNGRFMKVLELGKVLVDPKVFPVLQTVSFCLEKGWEDEFYLVFRIWDRDNWLEGRVECFVKFDEGEEFEIWKRWMVTVNYFQLMKVLKEFSKKQIILIEKVDGNLVISDENIQIPLELQDELLKDKPVFGGGQNFVSELRLIVDNIDLLKAISYVDFARANSVDYKVNYTQGYYLDVAEGEKVYLVATDNHRLSCYQLPIKDKVGDLGNSGVLFTREQSLLLKNICQSTFNLVDIRVAELEGNEKVMITFLSLPFMYRGVSSVGRFPDWRGIVPEKFPRSMVVEDKVVKGMVDFIKKGEKLVKTVSQGKRKKDSFVDRVHFVFQEGRDTVKLEVWSTPYADVQGKKVFEKEFPCEWSGDNFLVAFNLSYISEVFSAIQGGLKMQFTDAVGITQIEDLKNSNFLHYLMPIDLSKIPS